MKTSISRLSSYAIYVSELALATEPSHPDYQALNHVKDKFIQREKQWRAMYVLKVNIVNLDRELTLQPV